MYCLIDKLIFYFQYPFVRYALIVGVLIALCSSLLGVTLVLKRFSFIGDGLSHVAFGAMAVASVLNFTNNMIFILPNGYLCSFVIADRTEHKDKRRCSDCYDFGRSVGNRLSADESVRYGSKSFRRCV